MRKQEPPMIVSILPPVTSIPRQTRFCVQGEKRELSGCTQGGTQSSLALCIPLYADLFSLSQAAVPPWW